MIYLYLLLTTSLSNTNDKILEQGDVFVPISDMDAYVYLLPPDKRAGFVNDKQQMEKNLITMLNINIVDDYIKTNGLETHDAFNKINDIVNGMEVNLDDEFYMKLGLDKNSAYDHVKDFIIKKERFIRMSDLIKTNLTTNGVIDNYLKEYFVINKDKFTIPEKRDISLIELNESQHNASEVKNLLNDLLNNDDFDYFSQIADEFSNDETVKYNHGHLKEYQHRSFSYPFADTVFSFDKTGVLPRIFKFKNAYYLVRINKITPELEPKFEEHKEQLSDELLPEIVQEKLQRIIDSKAKFKIKVNEELAAHMFERYKVLLEK